MSSIWFWWVKQVLSCDWTYRLLPIKCSERARRIHLEQRTPKEGATSWSVFALNWWWFEFVFILIHLGVGAEYTPQSLSKLRRGMLQDIPCAIGSITNASFFLVVLGVWLYLSSSVWYVSITLVQCFGKSQVPALRRPKLSPGAAVFSSQRTSVQETSPEGLQLFW